MPHVALVSVDGEALGPVELDQADPPDGTLVILDGVELRVVGRIDADDPEHQFDVVVVVACRPAAQLERLMIRDRLTLDQARARLAAQWPIEDKARLADRVIATDGPREDTVRQARAMAAWLATQPRTGAGDSA